MRRRLWFQQKKKERLETEAASKNDGTADKPIPK
jgi:hypothetical protein